jgi:hypothetical protein
MTEKLIDGKNPHDAETDIRVSINSKLLLKVFNNRPIVPLSLVRGSVFAYSTAPRSRDDRTGN